MTWVLLVGGPLNGKRYDIQIVGEQVRYPEDDEDGGRYVWLGSSGDGGDLLYTWSQLDPAPSEPTGSHPCEQAGPGSHSLGRQPESGRPAALDQECCGGTGLLTDGVTSCPVCSETKDTC